MAAIGSGECDVGELDTTSSGDTDGDILSACSQLEAGSIQVIDRESVHRICSGQVVLTLATAVKELVENSIDAGATTVDIKLKEYGSESIEVTDNGSGVEEKNFAGLTQKHHTSKLSDFNDLIHVETFGFRGEALSSLCALSHMTVTTRHRSVAVGTKLEYDGNGHIVSKTPTPRQQGTTITLQNLFHTLPVRHKEFQRNLKKEFSKMVQVLNAYCIVNTGVRITCSNQTSKGSRSTVVSTNGNSTVKDNIANIFGPKQLQSLLPFEQRSPTEDVCTDYGIQSDACHTDLFSIEGFVSKCEHGQGRSSTDRQFIFINRRPCDVTKIVKVVNEVYHSYNRHQYPFVVLLITMAKESVDVNVTPDKRQIFMEGEKILLATIKTSLVKMFEPTTSILRMNPFPQPPGSLGTTSDSSGTTGTCPAFVTASQSSPDKLEGNVHSGVKDGCALSSLARLKRSFSSAFDRTDRRSWTSPIKQQPDKQRKLETFLNKSHSTPARFSPDKGSIIKFFTASSSSPSPAQKPLSFESVSPNKSVSDDVLLIEHTSTDRLSAAFDKTDSLVVSEGVSARLSNCSEEAIPESDERHRSLAPMKIVLHEVGSGVEDGSDMVGEHSRRIDPSMDPETLQPQDLSHSAHEPLQSDTLLTSSAHAGREDSEFDDPGFHMRSKERNRDSNKTGSDGEEAMTIVSVSDSSEIESQASCHFSSAGSSNTVKDGAQQQPHMEEEDNGVQLETSDEKTDRGSTSTSLSVTVTQFDKDESRTRRESELPFSFQKLRACLTSADMKSKKERDSGFSRSFRAKICPTDNKSAEDELQREISKDMFSKMDVLGQFNLGFIIAKNGEDLFIVDQHATDEKYNFEMLQRHTVLQSQQLIQPQGLELTASNEVILIDNLDIFRKNGFDFVIDETAPPTQRVKLKSTPISKNWTFGKDDIEELIFMLTDSPGVMCRPSRVRMMFASRACRKSIMIGTHLNKSEMKKLLCHMGEIEQPWNCPHGRPTMRHLINLDMLPCPDRTLP